MIEGSGLETNLKHNGARPEQSGDGASDATRDAALGRALLFIGIAAASAGLAYALVRVAMARRPSESDPTTERIQALIDEANRLLKQLDDKTSA